MPTLGRETPILKATALTLSVLRAPGKSAIRHQLEQRPAWRLLGVRPVLRAKCVQSLVLLPRLEDLHSAQDLNPGKPAPVVLVVIDRQRRLRAATQIRHTRNLFWSHTLRLGVDCAVKGPF